MTVMEPTDDEHEGKCEQHKAAKKGVCSDGGVCRKCTAPVRCKCSQNQIRITLGHHLGGPKKTFFFKPHPGRNKKTCIHEKMSLRKFELGTTKNFRAA